MLPKSFELPGSLEFVGVPRDYGKVYGNVVWGMVSLDKVWIPAALNQLPDDYFDVDCLDEPIRVPVRGYVSFPDPSRAFLRFEVDQDSDYLFTHLNGELSAIQAALQRQTKSRVLWDIVYTGFQITGAGIHLTSYHIPFVAFSAWVAVLERLDPTSGFTVTVLDSTPQPPTLQQFITFNKMPFTLRSFEPPVFTGTKR